MGDYVDPMDVSTENERVKLMMAWFLANFENPSDNTPWDEEYVFIWGGPFHAREELEKQFGAVESKEDIDRLVFIIERENDEWAPCADGKYGERRHGSG